MTRRTLVAKNLANYFLEQGVDNVNTLSIQDYQELDNPPYNSMFLRRLFGSWSRGLSIVGTILDSSEEFEVVEKPSKDKTPENKTLEDKTLEVKDQDPFAAFKRLTNE